MLYSTQIIKKAKTARKFKKGFQMDRLVSSVWGWIALIALLFLVAFGFEFVSEMMKSDREITLIWENRHQVKEVVNFSDYWKVERTNLPTGFSMRLIVDGDTLQFDGKAVNMWGHTRYGGIEWSVSGSKKGLNKIAAEIDHQTKFRRTLRHVWKEAREDLSFFSDDDDLL